MGAASNDGRGRWVLEGLAGALLCGVLACATAGGGRPGNEGSRLSDVKVEAQGEATRVELRGVRDRLYAVVPSEEGRRLSLRLNETRPVGLPDAMASLTGVVEEIEIASGQDRMGGVFTEVDLHLAEPVEHEVSASADGLVLELRPRAATEIAAAEEEAPASGSELLAMEPEQAFADEAAASPAAAEIAAAPPAAAADREPEAAAPPATALVGLEVTPEGVRLRTDGRVTERESFVLEDPARLVIDLPGLANQGVPARVPGVAAAQIAAVRTGQHAEKVRVVIDAGAKAGSLGNWEVRSLDDGLLVAAAREGAVQGDASPAAEAPAAKAPETAADGAEASGAAAGPEPGTEAATTDSGTEAEGSVAVTDLALREDGASTEIVVSTRGEASYRLYEPDAETVVVSLPDAQLAAGAEARIAPEPGGPVSLVMAFEQPETERPEVRVVVTRAAGAKPHIEREAGGVVISFPRAGAVAQTPPALREEGEDPAAAEASTAPAKALAQAKQPGPASLPAAPAPESEGIDILEQGGLLEGKEYVGRRISLDFKDVEIDDVLRLIADVSDLNIIAGDNVSGTVTIRLVDVPWDQALDVILMTKGLGFTKVGNVLRIAPKNLLQQEAEARLQERRAKEKLEDLIVKFQPVNYADVNEVAKMVQRLLSPRGTVDTDPRTNTVILKDIPSVVDESVALIKAIDTPTPQVLIEAKIVEANLDFSRELGMVWGFGLQQQVDGFDDSSGVATNQGVESFRFRPDSELIAPSGPTEDLNNFVIQNPISQASDANALVNLGAFLLDQNFNLEAQLQAAESTGEGKVISSPRVVTLDNREAEIQQGVAIPFQTFENGDAQLQFVDAVLELKVTPHITADRSIIMDLEVSRNAPDDSVATNTGTPGIRKNETETETLVRDGQTLVIGGIYTIQKSERQNRVPYLHSVPGLGNLFRNKAVRDIRQELLIFVTPRIVEMPELGS